MGTYTYMVAYSFATDLGGSGFGRVFITRSEPISLPEHIEGIEAIQNERNGFRCAIQSFNLLSHTADD